MNGGVMPLADAVQVLREHRGLTGVPSWPATPGSVRAAEDALLAHAEATLAVQHEEPEAVCFFRDVVTRDERHPNVAHVPVAYREARGVLAHIDTLAALVAEAELPFESAADLDLRQACLEACPHNDPSVIGLDDIDQEAGAYVLINGDGDRLIDTDDPAEVVRGLAGALIAQAAQREALWSILRRAMKAVGAQKHHDADGREVGSESLLGAIRRVLAERDALRTLHGTADHAHAGAGQE